MEHAPLRPVPARPTGRVDPDAAIRHVAATLPDLDGPAATALGLVALAGSSRRDAASRAGLTESELGQALARARKALRRSLCPLPSSGWCERAELMISDRLDEALASPGPERLAAHLHNCPRCVEHERRLVQAADELVAGLGQAKPAAPEARVLPTLSVVRRSQGPAVLPFGVPVSPAPRRQVPPRSESLPLQRTRPALAWSVLFVLALALTLAALAIAAAGLLGALL